MLEECEQFVKEMNQHNTDNIPHMNGIIDTQQRWNEYPTIRAHNEFELGGKGNGITRVAYAKIKQILGTYKHGGRDILINSTHY